MPKLASGSANVHPITELKFPDGKLGLPVAQEILQPPTAMNLSFTLRVVSNMCALSSK
jgi:hypothetical protein